MIESGGLFRSLFPNKGKEVKLVDLTVSEHASKEAFNLKFDEAKYRMEELRAENDLWWAKMKSKYKLKEVSLTYKDGSIFTYE